MTREIFKEQIEKVLRPRFKCYYSKLTNSVTRMRILENRTEMTYLDYFITATIDDPQLEIMSQIGQ